MHTHPHLPSMPTGTHLPPPSSRRRRPPQPPPSSWPSGARLSCAPASWPTWKQSRAAWLGWCRLVQDRQEVVCATAAPRGHVSATCGGCRRLAHTHALPCPDRRPDRLPPWFEHCLVPAGAKPCEMEEVRACGGCAAGGPALHLPLHHHHAPTHACSCCSTTCGSPLARGRSRRCSWRTSAATPSRMCSSGEAVCCCAPRCTSCNCNATPLPFPPAASSWLARRGGSATPPCGKSSSCSR